MTYEEQYLALLEHVLLKGAKTDNRTGIPSYSVFGGQISASVDIKAFPVLTTKKIAWNSLVTELIWFLRGYTTVDFLNYYKCRIWDEWATAENCQKRGVPTGDLGPIYGEQWRHWGGYDSSRPVKVKDTYQEVLGDRVTAGAQIGWESQDLAAGLLALYAKHDQMLCRRWRDRTVFLHEVKLMPGFPKWARYQSSFELMSFHKDDILAPDTSAFFPANTGDVLPSLPVDQIAALITEATSNPDSRRLVVNAWNADAIPTQALTPCHNMFQVSVRPLDTESSTTTRVMDMKMYQRSADIFLGVPFNFTSYALLLALLARACGYTTGSLTIQFGDLHIYENHVEAAVTQLRRKPRGMPKLELTGIRQPEPGLPWFDNLSTYHTRLIDYDSHPAIAAKVAV